jgi:hypothetical protein
MTRRASTGGSVAGRGTGDEAGNARHRTDLNVREYRQHRFSAVHSVRRAAPASRTCGRSAVGPTGRSLTPTPYSTLPNNTRNAPRKDQQPKPGVDRPRSLRDDTKSGQQGWLPALGVPEAEAVVTGRGSRGGCRRPSKLMTAVANDVSFPRQLEDPRSYRESSARRPSAVRDGMVRAGWDGSPLRPARDSPTLKVGGAVELGSIAEFLSAFGTLAALVAASIAAWAAIRTNNTWRPEAPCPAAASASSTTRSTTPTSARTGPSAAAPPNTAPADSCTSSNDSATPSPLSRTHDQRASGPSFAAVVT